MHATIEGELESITYCSHSPPRLLPASAAMASEEVASLQAAIHRGSAALEAEKQKNAALQQGEKTMEQTGARAAVLPPAFFLLSCRLLLPPHLAAQWGVLSQCCLCARVSSYARAHTGAD